MIYGLESLTPSMDDLKAFSAAFATTSSSSMFHMFGVTPEASTADEFCRTGELRDNQITITKHALLQSYKELNTANTSTVDLICFGNPHFSITECEQLANMCDRKTKNPNVRIMVTLGRSVHNDAKQRGYVNQLEKFGVEFITDACWCMITEPVIPKQAHSLMTNSGKYAHYGPALVQRDMHFGSISDCVDAATSGNHVLKPPAWLM